MIETVESEECLNDVSLTAKCCAVEQRAEFWCWFVTHRHVSFQVGSFHMFWKITNYLKDQLANQLVPRIEGGLPVLQSVFPLPQNHFRLAHPSHRMDQSSLPTSAETRPLAESHPIVMMQS